MEKADDELLDRLESFGNSGVGGVAKVCRDAKVEIERLEFLYQQAESAARRLGSKWKAAVSEQNDIRKIAP